MTCPVSYSESWASPAAYAEFHAKPAANQDPGLLSSPAALSGSCASPKAQPDSWPVLQHYPYQAWRIVRQQPVTQEWLCLHLYTYIYRFFSLNPVRLGDDDENFF
jgi:hypothetical protein